MQQFGTLLDSGTQLVKIGVAEETFRDPAIAHHSTHHLYKR